LRHSVQTLVWYLATHFDCATPIVDIGSRQSPNQLVTADLRQFFRGKEYIGCDTELGVGVDRVENIERLSFEDESVSTLLCVDTLEHVEDPLRAMEEVRRVLKPDGLVVVTSHMYAPVHYNPDYWRFTPQCFDKLILRGFGARSILVAGEEHFPEVVAAIATKADALPFAVDVNELNSMLSWPYPFGYRQWSG
jgi:SAM-dependent methyltransferase